MVDLYKSWLYKTLENAKLNRNSSEWVDTFDWEDVTEFVKNKEALVALNTAHNHVEIALKFSLSILSRVGEPKDKLELKHIGKIQFVQLCNLCRFLKLIDGRLHGKLKKFNSLRNRWIHAFVIKEKLIPKEALDEAMSARQLIREITKQLYQKYHKLQNCNGKTIYMFT